MGQSTGLRGTSSRILAAAALLLSCRVAAACPNLIDCRGSGNEVGLWYIAHSPEFPAALIGATAVGALWDGSDTRMGRTLWQTLDASALSGIATLALKKTFQRDRPSQSDSPDHWFSGAGHQSFPSGDVSAVAAVVTPMIAEYHDDHPAVWALAALPVFDMAARIQVRAHWPTDVLAGAAVGVGSGLLVRRLKTPFFVMILPQGVTAGFRAEF